jgi:hypothetical protein
LINWGIRIVSSDGKIRVSWFRGPRIEREGDLAGESLHALTHPSLCDLYTSNYLSTEGVAGEYILLRKRRSTELEEVEKTAALDQTKCLNV